MTSCQEYLLKIKFGEMNSIWKVHTSGKQKKKEEMLQQLSLGPNSTKFAPSPVELHATRQDYVDFFMTASEIRSFYNKSLKDRAMCLQTKLLTLFGAIFVFSIAKFIMLITF